MRPDSPQDIVLVPPALPETRKKRRTWKDEDEYEYGLSAGDGDDAEWAGEPEVEVDEEEEESEEGTLRSLQVLAHRVCISEPYAPAGDADADDADADAEMAVATKAKAKPKAKAKAKAAASSPAASSGKRSSPALAKKVVKKATSTARQRLQQKIGFHGTPARAFPAKR